MDAFRVCVTRWMIAMFWVFRALQQSESAIVCQAKPDDPQIVVFGVNSSVVSLNWKTCSGNAGETFISFSFSRRRPDSIATEKIASRRASEGGFTMEDLFKDKKKYDARLDQELRIFDVEKDDEYIYLLEIDYRRSDGAFLKEVFRVTVDVKVPPKITTAPAREVQLSLNLSSVQNYTLNCNASGDPHPNITWTKSGVPRSQFNASGYLLHLVDVKREDAGSYICTASNGYGDDATAISIVNIRCSDCKTERVGITIHGVDYKPILSNQASIEFKNLESKLLAAIWSAYTGHPEKQLYRVDVEDFRSGSVYAVVQLEFGSTVSDPLKPLRDEMNDGELGSFTVDRQLDVNPTLSPSTTTELPPNITTAPAREVQLSLSLSSVQNYTLKCNASGDPHPNITWKKSGVPASQFNASGYVLHLVDVKREDAGSYICTASNGYGEDATAISIVNIRCTDCRTERVGITIQGMDYKPHLSNQASIEFQNFESKLLSAIWGTYNGHPEKQLYRVDVEDFRFGSVYAVVELEFGSTVSDPLKPLRDEMNDGKLGSFTVDRQLDVNPTLSPSTTTKLPPVPPTITTAPACKVQLSLSLSSVQNHILKCNASGYPHPNITWTKDGVPPSQFSASGSLLYLDDVQREDGGSYICTASNGYGEDATSISIVNIRCSHCRTERVGITIQGMEYKPHLSNQASIEFKNFESKLLSAIWGTYTGHPEKQLYRVDVEDFRSGSIYAVVELKFGSTVSDPLKPLRDEMNDGKLASFTVDRQLDVNPTLSPSTTSKSAGIRPETGGSFFTPFIQLPFVTLWWLSLLW